MKERACPICEKHLDHEEFKQKDDPQYINIWNDEKYAIPCCVCYEILKDLTEQGEFEIKYPYDLSMVWRLLNNLSKIGFISTEVRDEKYKKCVEFDKNYKLRTKMIHFLV